MTTIINTQIDFEPEVGQLYLVKTRIAFTGRRPGHGLVENYNTHYIPTITFYGRNDYVGKSPIYIGQKQYCNIPLLLIEKRKNLIETFNSDEHKNSSWKVKWDSYNTFNNPSKDKDLSPYVMEYYFLIDSAIEFVVINQNIKFSNFFTKINDR